MGVLGEAGGGGGGPVAGGKEGVGGTGVVAPESGDEGGLVDGEGDGLSDAGVLDAGVGEGGILDVEVEVVDARAGAGVYAEVGLIAEGVDHVHGEEIAFDVGGTFFHL